MHQPTIENIVVAWLLVLSSSTGVLTLACGTCVAGSESSARPLKDTKPEFFCEVELRFSELKEWKPAPKLELPLTTRRPISISGGESFASSGGKVGSSKAGSGLR